MKEERLKSPLRHSDLYSLEDLALLERANEQTFVIQCY